MQSLSDADHGEEALRRVRALGGTIDYNTDTLGKVLDAWLRSTQAPLVQAAMLLAMRSHAGQLDKSGQPYILHPLRVMTYAPATAVHQAIALLHDVVEDTPVSLDDLRGLRFPEAVVVAVDFLTHRTEGSENHYDYVRRCCRNELAKAVKYADIRDNMDPIRIDALGSQGGRLREKYRKSLAILDEAE